MVAENRPTAQQRGYDKAWRAVRAAHLKIEPWCRMCRQVGQRTAATDVDHIVRIRDGGKRLDHANLRSLCSTHHKSKSGRESHGLTEKYGATVTGMPADPNHPWNR